MIAQFLKLPCGQVLKNRLAKSAMSENMAKNQSPGEEFINLYRTWSRGGAGLLISGNIMVDSRHLGEPNNVVIEKELDNIAALKKWAAAVEGSDTKLWLQLNHPGKQSPSFINKNPVAPSAIPFSGMLKKVFNTPRALSVDEINEIIDRFGYSAKVAKECGFHGVQIHGAHGYLVSQFLSPRHNIREDQFGGSLENRARFVKEIYLKMRAEVGPQFPIGIKINSADFSKGGFTNEEAVETAKLLSGLGMDLIEISGGSYEAPAMMGAQKESTKKREAYFLEYTKEIKRVISCPLMVTGGFRTRDFMEESLESGALEIIGLARPLALEPDICQKIVESKKTEIKLPRLTSGSKLLDSIVPLEIVWYTNQIHRMGKSLLPDPKASVYKIIFGTLFRYGVGSLRRLRA